MATKKTTKKTAPKTVKRATPKVKYPPHIHEQHPNLIWLLLLFVAVMVGIYFLKVYHLDPYYMPEQTNSASYSMD